MALAHSPQIVTNGLVFCLDVANLKSYPGTGTAVINLANNNAGETQNSPTYSANNQGFFSFSSPRLIRFQDDTTLNTQTPSVEVWIRTNNTNQNGFWFEKGQVNTQYSLFQDGTEIRWRANTGVTFVDLVSVTTSNFINTTNWYQIVGTFTSGSQVLYINGSIAGTGTTIGTISTNAGGMSIGVYGGFSGFRDYFYNGDLSMVRVYNRVLSAAEVRQNFNALRGRYGI